MTAPLRLVITGATGFVGQHLLDRALAEGHSVAALTRREQPARERVDWVVGALERTDALQALCHHADAVIHVAGVISAPDAAGFEAGNVTGTLAMLAAATASGVQRFVHVSSLAAREPGLSLYGASKARSEELVEGSGLDWSIVRPPAVYGPGDRETLDLFKMAKRGLVMLPPKGRLSLIHVDDLADLLLALAGATGKALYEPDDGHPLTHRALAAALGAAFSRKVAALSTPAPLLKGAAHLDRLVRGPRAKLTPDRASYFSHPDWAANPARAVPAALWQPRVALADGLAATAQWYRREGWL
ncbi:NAD(P)-dependent oxidoreductase [Sphingomonas sp. ASV193]|uniref:NAD-dependent epimerase/dehydratase family protein n=1 Tax=Sphingomonas sp. ASV193 TaxID=3144405 RepID=UPI0032E8B30B